MNNSKVNKRRSNFDYEIQFTNNYKQARKEAKSAAELELACLKTQYPAILHKIQKEDLFAGRLEWSAVGMGIQHQTGGFGYFIDEKRIQNALEQESGSLKYREDLHELLTYWHAERTDSKVLRGMSEELKKHLPSDDWLGLPLPAVPILRIAGTYLNFDKLVQIGLPGLKYEILENKAKSAQNEAAALYDCMLGAIGVLEDVCLYYKSMAEKMASEEIDEFRKQELRKMAEVLEYNTLRAPETMREAMQLVWLYGIVTPVLSFGRMDVYLGDLYVKDIQKGILTKEDAVKLTQSFYILIDHLDCETDGRVIVGGYGRRNPREADAFCHIAIEACRTVKEILPQFTLRFHSETPKSIWQESMQCIEEGRTYPLLYNDDVLIPAIMKAYGVDRKRAESYVPLGCGEIEFDHYSFGTPSGSLNALKILEIAMHGGVDPISREKIGLPTKPLAQCKTFEEFYEQYKMQLEYFIEAQADFELYQYKAAGKIHPFMFVSMLYDGCLEKGKAIFDGGCESLNGTLEVYGMINAGDSLTSIKELVFDKKSIQPETMLKALAMNFAGYEKECKLMMDVPKYGNDIAKADDRMVDLHAYICGTIKRQAERVGLDTYLAVVINNAQNTTLARWVGATPDGRKAGTATANANNPSSGKDKNGITAMLNSLLKLPHDNHAGMVQNIRLSRELFTNSREKVKALIDSYFERGGAHLMISVVGKEDLKNAMAEPEKYRDLIVRVGGFSARFVNLEKDVQKEIYERTTY